MTHETAREKIARAFWPVNCADETFDEAKADAYRGPYEFSLEVADAILAALPSIIEDMVEPLDWELMHFGWVSGDYIVQDDVPDAEASVRLGDRLLFTTGGKAAAQKHSNKPILKALGMKEGE